MQPGRQSILSPAAAAAADAALDAPLAADAAAAAALEPPPEAAEEDAAACRSFRLLLMSHSAPTRSNQGVAEREIWTYTSVILHVVTRASCCQKQACQDPKATPVQAKTQ